MRQLNEKAGKTGTVFDRNVKGAAAEAAEFFSHRAFRALPPAEQDTHGWMCLACPQSARALKLFGSAVVNGNRPGAGRRADSLRISHALMSSAPKWSRGVIYIYIAKDFCAASARYAQTHLCRWRGLP